MPNHDEHAELLQKCSQNVSSLIQLEKKHHDKMVHIEGEALEFPEELIQTLKQKFRNTRVITIVALNQIHL